MVLAVVDRVIIHRLLPRDMPARVVCAKMVRAITAARVASDERLVVAAVLASRVETEPPPTSAEQVVMELYAESLAKVLYMLAAAAAVLGAHRPKATLALQETAAEEEAPAKMP